MHFYEAVVLPRLCDWAMKNHRFAPYRQRVLAAARGRVLEIGMGSGLNLPFYTGRVASIGGLEPAPALIARTRRRLAARPDVSVSLIQGTAESIPLQDASVDTVVTTWTLCSIPDVGRALAEMHRVLKPHGQLLFVEHGLAPQRRVRKWQNRLTPMWSRISGGCHLNRPIGDLIERSGFTLDHLDTGYMRGPKPATFMYEGRALPR